MPSRRRGGEDLPPSSPTLFPNRYAGPIPSPLASDRHPRWHRRRMSPSPPSRRSDAGARLGAQERSLRLLLSPLAGAAVRRRVEIDDLVQEVWRRAWKHRGGLPPEEAEEAGRRRFLARLARNTVVDVARAIRAAERDGGEERLARSDGSHAGVRVNRLADAAPGPATGGAAREGCERILAAYERLDPLPRRVIGLRLREGLSARDAGARMGRGRPPCTTSSGSLTARGRSGPHQSGPPRVAFPPGGRCRPPDLEGGSRLQVRPARTPLAASPPSSRTTAQDSGPG